jgi:nitrogen-specific signal transduction histidine kinase/CheY-like chemotaxis protein
MVPVFASVVASRYSEGWTITVRDLRAHRQLQRDLRRVQKLSAMGQLTAGIVHDVNNLLTGILGSADAALRKLEREHPVRRDLELLRDAAAGGSSMVRRLARTNGHGRGRCERIDLRAAVYEDWPMLELLVSGNLRLSCETLEPGRVDLAGGELEQLLMNLVANARDALEHEGHITVCVRQTEYARGDGGLLPHMAIEVRDDGPGMDEQTAARALDPFFSTKSPDRGTGLGLSTVREIAEERGGCVQLDTRPGAGTAVRVLLPCAEEELAPQAGHCRPADRGADGPRGPEGPAKAPAGRVLLVEDYAVSREAMHEFLEGEGLQVRSVSQASEAVRRAGEGFRPDLLIVDVRLPDASGLELARQLRKKVGELPVLYVSGWPEDDPSVQQALHDPLSRYLAKPVELSELADMVQAMLGARAATADRGEPEAATAGTA